MVPITLTRFGQTVRKIIVIISALQQIGSQPIRKQQQLEEEKKKPPNSNANAKLGAENWQKGNRHLSAALWANLSP